MCDAGRLNYKWIGREDRLKDVQVRKVGQASSLSPADFGQAGSPPNFKSTWTAALSEIADKLKKTPQGSVAIVRIGPIRRTRNCG